MDNPIIAVTMGDPAGIGPELVARVLAREDARQRCRPLVVGDPQVMVDAARVAGLDLAFRTIRAPAEARFAPHEIDVLHPAGVHVGHVRWGVLDAAYGEAAAACLRAAFAWATEGAVQGVVSAPLNKEAFHLAGYDHSDELVYLAELTASPDTCMVGVMNDAIWTLALTEHIPFRQIADAVRQERVLRAIHRLDRTLKQAGYDAAPIGVAALNVHGGEGGLFGREEIDEIEPAIAEARARGIDAHGPIPADAIFPRALAGEFRGVVCMYHDQANIARKLQPMAGRVTLFLGLPVPCGTTAHGTAFDIAGRGLADPGSMEAALRYTVMLAG
jgi:4-hydroxythreonine-4-phosphate dehydrogenase